MSLQLKFKASKVDEIEKAKGLPIQNCIADTSVGMLTLFIEKAVLNEDSTVGCTKNTAMRLLDEYLEEPEHDTDCLVLDIMEALVNGGFLSRQLNMEQVRSSAKKEMENQLKKI